MLRCFGFRVWGRWVEGVGVPSEVVFGTSVSISIGFNKGSAGCRLRGTGGYPEYQGLHIRLCEHVHYDVSWFVVHDCPDANRFEAVSSAFS